jgi:hypothetical protein
MRHLIIEIRGGRGRYRPMAPPPPPPMMMMYDDESSSDRSGSIPM